MKEIELPYILKIKINKDDIIKKNFNSSYRDTGYHKWERDINRVLYENGLNSYRTLMTVDINDKGLFKCETFKNVRMDVFKSKERVGIFKKQWYLNIKVTEI